MKKCFSVQSKRDFVTHKHNWRNDSTHIYWLQYKWWKMLTCCDDCAGNWRIMMTLWRRTWVYASSSYSTQQRGRQSLAMLDYFTLVLIVCNVNLQWFDPCSSGQTTISCYYISFWWIFVCQSCLFFIICLHIFPALIQYTDRNRSGWL